MTNITVAKYYNEMMELWGSLFEGVVYGIYGKLPEKGRISKK